MPRQSDGRARDQRVWVRIVSGWVHNQPIVRTLLSGTEGVAPGTRNTGMMLPNRQYRQTIEPFDWRTRKETAALLELARRWQRPAAVIRALNVACRDALFLYGDSPGPWRGPGNCWRRRPAMARCQGRRRRSRRWQGRSGPSTCPSRARRRSRRQSCHDGMVAERAPSSTLLGLAKVVLLGVPMKRYP